MVCMHSSHSVISIVAFCCCRCRGVKFHDSTADNTITDTIRRHSQPLIQINWTFNRCIVRSCAQTPQCNLPTCTDFACLCSISGRHTLCSLYLISLCTIVAIHLTTPPQSRFFSPSTRRTCCFRLGPRSCTTSITLSCTRRSALATARPRKSYIQVSVLCCRSMSSIVLYDVVCPREFRVRWDRPFAKR